jgi:hypothetical protein
MVGVLGQVDLLLGIAAQEAIGILEKALGAPSAPASVAASLDNPALASAPAITPPRMPGMVMRKPAPATEGVVINVGRHGGEMPPRTRPGALGGLKKPDTNRPAEPPDRPPMRPNVPPRPAGWDPSDDKIPL